MAINLTTTSYLVLGLVMRMESATPYDLKRAVLHTIEYFWAFPHSQLYAEPERLKRAGYLQESRERGGRRRRSFTITDQGRAVLEAWLKEPTAEPVEIRDLGLLKLYFGELASVRDMRALAQQQAELHGERLAEYERLRQARQSVDAAEVYPLAVLQMGIHFERAALAFWTTVGEAPLGEAPLGEAPLGETPLQFTRRPQPQFDSEAYPAKPRKRARKPQSKKIQEPLPVAIHAPSPALSQNAEPPSEEIFENAILEQVEEEIDDRESTQEDLPDHLL